MRGKFAGIAIIRVGLLQLPDISPSSGAFRATFPPRGKAFPALRGNKSHCAVGAGYAPPATEYYNEYNGLACRGGIYVKSNIGNTQGRHIGYSLRMWRSSNFPSTASTVAIL